MGEQAILSGHYHATLERIRAQDVVVSVPDPTLLDDGTTHPKSGMGTVKLKARDESLLHPTVACTPERMNLGVLGLKVWQRPAPPVAHERHRTPMAEQERDRWLRGDQLACEVPQSCPDALVVQVADRAGEMQEWLLEAARRSPGERAEFIIRAKGDRRISTKHEASDVWAARQKARAVGSITVERTRQPNRPPRQATLTGAGKRVMLTGAR
jgi:hypothetical protein